MLDSLMLWKPNEAQIQSVLMIATLVQCLIAFPLVHLLRGKHQAHVQRGNARAAAIIELILFIALTFALSTLLVTLTKFATGEAVVRLSDDQVAKKPKATTINVNSATQTTTMLGYMWIPVRLKYSCC